MISWLISILLLLNGSEKSSELNTYLASKLTEFKRYEYEIVSIPKSIESIDDQKVVFNKEREFKLNYGLAHIPVKVKVNDKQFTSSYITVRLKLYDDVLVSVKKIKNGSTLSKADFVLEEREITRLRYKPIKSWDKINTYRASRNIRKDVILIEYMAETIPDIEIGDKVYAYSTIGSVTVSFPVTTRQEGRVGEVIRVVRNDDNRMFKAEVVEKGKLKIVE